MKVIRKNTWLVLIVVSLLPFPGPAFGAVDDLQMPAGVRVREVAGNMVWNGIPMRVLTFKTGMGLERTLEAFERELKRAGAQSVHVNQVGPMHTLGATMGEVFVNIQGENRKGSGGSGGFIVFSPHLHDLPERYSAVDFPLPDDLKVLSHERYNDPGRQGESLMGTSPRYASSVGRDLVDGFFADGWKPASSEPRLYAESEGPDINRWLQKGDRICRLIATDQARGINVSAVVSIVCHN
jgi:hypothetical protein